MNIAFDLQTCIQNFPDQDASTYIHENGIADDLEAYGEITNLLVSEKATLDSLHDRMGPETTVQGRKFSSTTENGTNAG